MKRFLLLIVAVLALASHAEAQCTGVNDVLTPYAAESITVSSTALGFTAATYSPGVGSTGGLDPNPPRMAVGVLETDQVRFLLHGGTPTSSVGLLVSSGSSITVCGATAIKNFRAIRVTGDATLQVIYFR